MAILVITTGGTMGALPYKDYKHTAHEKFVSTMPPEGQDFVRDALIKDFDFSMDHFLAFEQRDSKLMDEAYRRRLLETIRSRPEKKVLVTHGTDTLLQTADFFYQELAKDTNHDKTILLTGSMMPLATGPESDGYLNLRFSLRQLGQMEASKQEKGGVYIVLCDYEHPEAQQGAWKPHLYEYFPGMYEKIYNSDGRYNRLSRVKSNAG